MGRPPCLRASCSCLGSGEHSDIVRNDRRAAHRGLRTLHERGYPSAPRSASGTPEISAVSGVVANGRFSIAASVKPRLDYLMLSPFCASANDHTGLLLLFEVSAKPPHDGMRRMGWYNLLSALAADERQDRRTLRTHPTRPQGEPALRVRPRHSTAASARISPAWK